MCQSFLEIFGRSTSELDVFSTIVFARYKLIALKRMKFIVSSQTKKKIINCSVSAHFQTCSSPIFFLLSLCSIRLASLCFPPMTCLYIDFNLSLINIPYLSSFLSFIMVIGLTLNLCTMLGLAFELKNLWIIVLLIVEFWS